MWCCLAKPVRHVASLDTGAESRRLPVYFISLDFHTFFQWLEGTWGSVFIRESTIVYPLIETTHVLTLCLFLGLIALWDLRLAGIGLRGVSVSQVGERLLPWALFGFVVMAISGFLLFYSGPLKAAKNPFFQIKMVMIALTGVNALAFHLTIFKQVAVWDNAATPPARVRMAGWVSIFLWCGVVICGRMQAYNWFN